MFFLAGLSRSQTIRAERATSCAPSLFNGRYAVHLVNNGASRQTMLNGLPANLKKLRIYVTDRQRGMKEGG